MRIIILLLILLFFSQITFAENSPIYILDNSKQVLSHCDEVIVKKDVRGIVIRIEVENIENNYYSLTKKLREQLDCIEYFLAKIKNPVIIEVHTEKILPDLNLKNWEFSSVIAGNIGDYLIKSGTGISAERILPVGFGEYMPDINTSNNGGKYTNRVDIIVLYNMDGE